MGKPNYRVVVSFDPQRASWSARAPELEHLTGEGPSRKDAIAKLEEEIDAQLANMLSLGSEPPRASDEIEHSGEVTAKISKSLHRELFYLSRTEGVELDQLVSELLASALAQRQGPRGTSRKQQAQGMVPDDVGNRVDAPRHSNADGNRSDGNRADGNRGGGAFRRGNNPQLLDDRANFIEYVRTLEQSPPAGNQQRGGFPRPGNNGGDAANRRRRGRGGPNPGGNPNHGQNPGNRGRTDARGGGGQPEGQRGQRPDGQRDKPRPERPQAAVAPAPTDTHE